LNPGPQDGRAAIQGCAAVSYSPDMTIASLREAVTTAGGSPTQYSHVHLLRELVTAWGGTPASFKINSLLREAITAAGGSPTQHGYVSLLRELVTALGGTPETYSPDALMAQLAGLASLSYSFANAEAGTYVAAMSVAPDDARKALIDTLVGDLKTDGIWTKLDWLCLLAAHDAQAARLNAKNTAKALTAVNAPTFTIDRGYAGNGSTSYLDFGEVANAAGNSYALNSATLGVWANTSGGTTTVGQTGLLTTNGTIRLIANNSGSTETYKINDGASSIAQVSPGTRAGHRMASRLASTTKRSFYNGVKTSELAATSTSITAENLVVCKADTSFSNDRMAACYSGGGLSDAEAGNMHSRLSTYLTAIGAN
jgi:hypothetical protein